MSHSGHSESNEFMGRIGALCGRYAWWVLAFWFIAIGALNLAVPQLEKTVAEQSAAFIPPNLPSTLTLKKMSSDFGTAKSTSIGSLVIVDEGGINEEDSRFIQHLMERLRADKDNIGYVLDTYDNDQTRSIALSPDGKAVTMLVAGTDAVGSSPAHRNTVETRELIEKLDKPEGVRVYYSGSSPILADLFTSIDTSLIIITAVSVVLIAVLLFVVYRSVLTAAIPLLTIGFSLGIARPIISLMGLYHIVPVSNFTIALMTALVLGGGTDYAIFILAGYHQARRAKLSVEGSLTQAAATTSPIIIASVCTIAASSVSMSFAEIGLFKTAGTPIAIGVALTLLVASTLPYALLSILGRRGFVEPRPLNERRWQRRGAWIIRHSRVLTAASLALLIALSSVLVTFRVNFDEAQMQFRNPESVQGYKEVYKHWGVNEAAPDFLMINADHDMRNTNDLAALELIAMGVSKHPKVAYVRSMTRPTGATIPETAIGYQVGIVGDRLGDASQQIAQSLPELTRLASGVNQLRAGAYTADKQLPELVSGVKQLAQLARQTLDSYTAANSTLLTATDGETSAADAINDLSSSVELLEVALQAFDENKQAQDATVFLGNFFAPLLTPQPSPECLSNPQCMRGREELADLNEYSHGALIRNLRQIQAMSVDPQDAIHNAMDALPELRTSLTGLKSLIAQFTGSSPSQVKSQLGQLTQGTERLSTGMSQLAGGLNQVKAGIDQVVSLTGQLGDGLTTASGFLSQLSDHTSSGPGSGFYFPPEGFEDPAFKAGSDVLFSQEGKVARLIVVWKENPYSHDILSASKEIPGLARNMAKGTVLENARFESTGLAAISGEMRDQVWRDFALFGLVALFGVLLVLMILLRSILAPILMVSIVILSFCATAGVSTIVWQHIIGIPLDWSVLPVAFIALVAVGADYSMLFALRIREESRRGMLQGIIRGFGSTGSVITTAGIVFALTMFALMSGNVLTLVQIGFAIGVGLIFDITVVRTFLVPALLALIGDVIWWPSPPVSMESNIAKKS